MTVYSYIVVYDSGFSPNPFHGVCTLACCKPMIRRSARIGDLVIGLSSCGERVVYAMRVEQVLGFTQVPERAALLYQAPEQRRSRCLARRGDNIYQPWAIGEFRQLPSRHSHPDGTENIENKRTDLSGLHVLSADNYAYSRPGGSSRASGVGVLEDRQGTPVSVHHGSDRLSRGMVRDSAERRARLPGAGRRGRFVAASKELIFSRKGFDSSAGGCANATA